MAGEFIQILRDALDTSVRVSSDDIMATTLTLGTHYAWYELLCQHDVYFRYAERRWTCSPGKVFVVKIVSNQAIKEPVPVARKKEYVGKGRQVPRQEVPLKAESVSSSGMPSSGPSESSYKEEVVQCIVFSPRKSFV